MPRSALLLEARIRPLGTAIVDVLVRDDGSHTIVEMHEHLGRGPGAMVPAAITDHLLDVRNAEALRQLEDLARQRAGTV